MEFAERYGRNYTSLDEYQFRFEAFKINLNEINRLNKELTSSTVGVN